MTGEHYISETVLEAISPNGSVQVHGFPWEGSDLRQIGIFFKTPLGENRVELWKDSGQKVVVYSKVGSTKETPPQWQPNG
jgi:hypothetical protein